MILEVQLIDDHRPTQPPDASPWDDARRGNDLKLRQHRLREMRRERLWAGPLHWSARLQTPERDLYRQVEVLRVEVESLRERVDAVEGRVSQGWGTWDERIEAEGVDAGDDGER